MSAFTSFSHYYCQKEKRAIPVHVLIKLCSSLPILDFHFFLSFFSVHWEIFSPSTRVSATERHFITASHSSLWTCCCRHKDKQSKSAKSSAVSENLKHRIGKYFHSVLLSSLHTCSVLVHSFIIFVSWGQEGEACQLSNNATVFILPKGTGEKRPWTFFLAFKSLTIRKISCTLVNY